MYMYPTIAMLLGIFRFWVRAVYNLQLVSYSLETVSNSVFKDALCVCSSTSGASVYIFRVWLVSQATPGILNAWNFE